MKALIIAAAVLALAGCARVERAVEAFNAPPWASDPLYHGDTYTLYRDSPVFRDMPQRVHVATFNTAEGGTYNDENCRHAAILFNRQNGIVTTFWCEQGEFRP